MLKNRVQVELKGEVERITYFNEENNYTIAKMKVRGRHDLVTVVGNFLPVTPGEALRLVGYWDSHPKYGEQFKVLSCESVLPATIKGMERYLGSGMIKGIGPVMAKRLVSTFGEETLAVIESHIERLHEVPGIGEKRVEMIKNAWEEQKEIREVMVFLQGQGVSPAYAVKIYRHYGRDAAKVVSENPYRLAMDIFGIGFITADRIAGKLGIARDSQMRTEAGILYVLNELSDDGHVYYPYKDLLRKCADILEVEEEKIPYALESIAAERKVVVEDILAPNLRLSASDPRAVYLAGLHVAELGVAGMLKTLSGFPKQLRLINIDEAIEWVQRTLRLALSERQVEAVKASVNAKTMVVTGGPGTGKTTIINAIIRIYDKMGQRILLAAPTGRAAKRMTEATGHEAKTIHRLLEYSPGSAAFKKNDTNPLEADLVIIDEASMIDTVLMYHFLKAVPVKATLLLVGDVDQLPSVGPGNILKDVIDSESLPTVRLNEIFRQSRESLIIVNAHRINRGLMPVHASDGAHRADFYFLAVEEPEKVVEEIVSLCRDRIPSRFGYNPMTDIQVLTPMHRGVVGVANLNISLQTELNHGTDELVRGGRTLKTGDKVMQMRNNYDKDVYNGDIGRVATIDRELHEVKVDFDGRIVAYDHSDLDELTLAYAISVHKSQGSEYPVVIMPVLTQHYMLLQRNLVYTGMTRGKKLVILIGTKKALAIAIKNNKPQKRYSMLRERLKG
ncbi:ATP-dependent RecD-like DNA helicase [Syntrophorhabdus aromaticivorans]|uniref:ATP-dependent RecD-like DNA helicase n=1 Tax=Syntrophorhabdus aromaticivorans TaxID=328301 RepID=A0A971M6L6_9BACT|nr:ATP-dependent RecD-like DNA helicase [Syntrophorhabdus aromaticivorans]NLW36294.1 ATP-dependent RecD-like DNA helicase [Syntrophorhabdus aromaticivorans]